jgi:hypothetical protein
VFIYLKTVHIFQVNLRTTKLAVRMVYTKPLSLDIKENSKIVSLTDRENKKDLTTVFQVSS